MFWRHLICTVVSICPSVYCNFEAPSFFMKLRPRSHGGDVLTLELPQLLDAHATWEDVTEPLRFFAVSKDNKWSDIKKHLHFFSRLLDASHVEWCLAKSVCARSQHKTNLGRRGIQKEVPILFAMPLCAWARESELVVKGLL